MNRNILSNAIMFTIGAAIGSAVTYVISKNKYEERMHKEIEELYDSIGINNNTAESDDSYADEDAEEDEPDEKDEYKELVKDSGYTENDEEEDSDDMVEPYVIVPEEFDENGYETITLYYYEDGVVETMLDKEVLDDDEIEEWIGKESLTHFGEYEEDSVFVRNDNMQTDFEILKVAGRWSEDN